MSTLVNTDSYKLSHKGFMNEGTELIYSNMTARSGSYFKGSSLYDNKIVWFGLQHFLKTYMIDEWNNKFFNQPKEEVVGKFKRLVDAYLGEGSVPMEHFEELHDLGYLPINIRSLPEGSRVPFRVPSLTIRNTNPNFAWLTNYLETVMSCELWKPSTTATTIYEFRRLVNEYAVKTTGTTDGTEFQVHGFEFRGMSGRSDAAINGAAFLISSCGTDTVPALEVIEDSYNTDITKNFIATSVPATEHSLACLGTEVEGELESYRRWITESYPTGIVSLVSDTFDYFKVLTEYLPALKDDILARPENALGLSKVVIRPDSGDPVEIICGINVREILNAPEDFEDWKAWVAEEMDDQFCVNLDAENPHRFEIEIYKRGNTYYEVKYEPDLNRHDKQYYYVDNYGDDVSKCEFTEITLTPEQKGSIEILWEVFGGEVNEQGYKVLDSHIGLIYGDSITIERCEEILKRLEAKGFATNCVVFGVGSYTTQYVTRDTLGFAIKATYATVNGENFELYKDPITDNGVKKSAKGLLKVVRGEDGEFELLQQVTPDEEFAFDNELKPVFDDGVLLVEEDFMTIRERLWPSS